MKQARTFRDMAELFRAGSKALSLAVLLKSKFLFDHCKQWNSKLLREQISLSFNHQYFPAVLITCRYKEKRPLFLLVKGLPVYRGKWQLFSRLARSLALLGFHVLIYEDPQLNSCNLDVKTLSNLRGIIRSIRALDWVDSERILIGGSDFSARFWLTLFQDPEISCFSKGLMLFSPVRDLDQLKKYAFSGKLKIHQRCKYLKPAMETQVVFLWNKIRADHEHEIAGNTTGIIKNIILHRIDVALREIARLKDEKLRAILLSLLRGDDPSEIMPAVQQMDYSKVQERIFGSHLQADLQKPVFLLHDIDDREIDAGQSVDLFNLLKCPAGIYLHLCQNLDFCELGSFWKNPIGRLSSMVRLAYLFYKIFAILTSNKNLPFNPEGKSLYYRI